MSRPPSLPSHPGPPSSYIPYPPTRASSSRSDSIPSSQQLRLGDPSTGQHNVQKLPSLRTVLEPELLNQKSSTTLYPSVVAPGGHNLSSRYGSPSPTLKRRHEVEGQFQAYPDHNAITSQTPHHQRPPLSIQHSDSKSAMAPALGSAAHIVRFESQRRDSYLQPSQHDPRGLEYCLSASASGPVGMMANDVPQDESEAIERTVRRRLDVSSRAPVRASRCVSQRDVPGEGICYVYEDGTYCRAIIDGEPVNPSWGITKAGKPRKRLAQACLTCREKKIKCEPGFPKCHQCAKSHRACRGGLNQTGADNTSGEISPSDTTPRYTIPAFRDSSPTAPSHQIKAPAEMKDSFLKLDAWNPSAPLRPRSFHSNPNASSRDMSVQSVDSDRSGSITGPGLEDSRPGQYQDRLALQWEQDPFQADPRLTMHLLGLYFLHAGRSTYGIFPRRPFLAWVETNRGKTPASLMLLYSVLAIGSLYSADPDKCALGKRFASIASYAAEKLFGKFSLPLCQSRLMLALYYFAQGESQKAWDFCGAGLRAISYLGLNTEEGFKELAEGMRDFDFDFDRCTWEECCRRTFWSGFLVERYNGFLGGNLFVISLEDAFVRLPCRESMYEASTPCASPFFDEALSSDPTSPSGSLLGDMAFACLIAATWSSVLTFTERVTRRTGRGYETAYEEFYTRTYESLARWRAILPPNLRYNPQNLDASIAEGNAGVFLSMHTLYHATMIRLNRHVCAHGMSTEKLRHNIKETVRNAWSVLSMMHLVAATNRQRRLTNPASSEVFHSTPFPGYALFMSIDVLTSVGTFAALPDLLATITATMSFIEELADFWAAARPQQRKMSDRLTQLTGLTGQEQLGMRNGSQDSYWKLKESLETGFGSNDVLYKVDDQLLLDVVREMRPADQAGHTDWQQAITGFIARSSPSERCFLASARKCTTWS